MDARQHWGTIRWIVERAIRNNGFCALATVDEDGSPRLAPIGSVVLGEPGTAVYFEQFPVTTRRNLDRDQRVCLMAVAGGLWPWLKALYRGRFETPPGIRLTGKAGPRRPATEEETRQWQARVRRFKGFKGYNLLWGEMGYVRELSLDAFEPLRLGKMGQGSWPGLAAELE